MSQIKIYSTDAIDKPFKELAMKRFGYGRGSISKAAEEALYMWIREMSRIDKALAKIKEAAEKDGATIAVVLFGSFARKEISFRDVDVGIIVDKNYDSVKTYEYYASLVGDDDSIDLSIVNDLPIEVQSSIFNDAIVLYCRDYDALYDYTIKIIKKSSDVKSTIKEVLKTV